MHTLIITGHTATDITLRSTPDHTTYAHLTVMDNRVWKDKISNEKHEEAIAFRLTLFGTHAENAHTYVGKGSTVTARCHMRPSQYEKDGVTYYGYDFIVDELDYVSLKKPTRLSHADTVVPTKTRKT